MNDDNYLTINEQGLAEINPTASSEIQNAFIDAYRNIQGKNTAQIGTQAHALGSDLEAPYGGLHGPSEYMRSRYQTPQTESRLAGLRTASQLSALNQLMQNDINSWKDKYTQAYRNYRKRKATTTTSTTPTNDGDNSGDVITNILSENEVVEDPFFRRAEQEKLYDELMEKQAKEKGMTVEQYEQYLSGRRNNTSQPFPVGIGSYDTSTNVFNNGLGV